MTRMWFLGTASILLLVSAGISGVMRVDQKVGSFAAFTQIFVMSSDVKIEVMKARHSLDQSSSAADQGASAGNAREAIKEANNKLSTLLGLAAIYSDSDDKAFTGILSSLNEVAVGLEDAEKALDQKQLDDGQRAAVLAGLEMQFERIVDLRSEANLVLAALSEQGQSEVRRLIIILLTMGVIAMILAIVGNKAVTRRIARPIVAISEASERIARGDTQTEIPHWWRRDEIGKLAQSLKVLREVQHEAVFQAERELEREKALKEQQEKQHRHQKEVMEELARKFEETVGDVARQVAAASHDVSDAASSLAQNVDRSSDRVRMASQRLAEASSGMTSAAAATDEFALSIGEVSSQATVSSERARKAALAATSADQTIGELTSSADKISQIVEVIASIAQRTNLLALNASIEAARSAESGRGFAVVASEVKELASQTRQETARVEALISSMQNATGQSASALSTIAMEVIELETSAGAIASAVDQQANAGQDLARAIDLAAQNTGHVSESFSDVSAVMTASLATASQLRDSSERLNAQSKRLREHVAEFLSRVRAA
ncbi:methyl-accepting chemotaxis protein [Altererythrobacter sp. GH1-8]|uniref:methyl-accepting chemotaxis protein n=1 Tax=Altererythrobacter sp. GH1-8 TaxID=3349333 RepID=UPI00374C90E0